MILITKQQTIHIISIFAVGHIFTAHYNEPVLMPTPLSTAEALACICHQFIAAFLYFPITSLQ